MLNPQELHNIPGKSCGWLNDTLAVEAASHAGDLRNICVCVLFGIWGGNFHEPTSTRRPIGFSQRFSSSCRLRVHRKFPQQERQVIRAEARSEMIARWASRSKRLN